MGIIFLVTEYNQSWNAIGNRCSWGTSDCRNATSESKLHSTPCFIISFWPLTYQLFSYGRNFTATFWGPFSRGVSPSKIGLSAPSLEWAQLRSKGHVSFYILKRSPGWFVWVAPTLLRGKPYLINEGNSLRLPERCNDLNLARVKSREEVQKVWHAVDIYFKYLEYGSTCKKWCKAVQHWASGHFKQVGVDGG
jgi:hypothetical protein